MDDESITRLKHAFAADRYLAHQVLFEHRHQDKTPEFHKSIISEYGSDHPRVLVQAFRGSAKSSILEEFAIIEALFERSKNILVLGNSYPRACERLQSIKHELETNEYILDLFGEQVGPTWNENKIVLSNNVCIQALGARQSLRGTRYLQRRPDLVLGDDLEDEENAATEEARGKMLRWLLASVIPALDPRGRVRINGTPLDVKSLLEKLRALEQWKSSVYPAAIPASTNPDEWEEALWPDRFSLDTLRKLYKEYAEAGEVNLFVQEMLCRAEDPATKLFQNRHIQVSTVVPTHSPTYLYCDPARTTRVRTSARTGFAVWSWVGGHRLYVHKAFGGFFKPDEIVNNLFQLNERFTPIQIGVEPDGLEEFIFQPLRSEQVRRGVTLPLAAGRSIRAPRDKDGFIGSLQPYFEAGEVTLSPECADLIAELLAFPSGKKDVVNALAYALRMRPGRPIYDDFSAAHITDIPFIADSRAPAYLAFNCSTSLCAAALVQRRDGAIRVLGDWVFDGNPGDGLDAILPDAAMLAGKPVLVHAPPDRFERFDPTGLVPAARRRGITLRKSHAPSVDTLAPWLRRTIKGFPAFMVSPSARWVINGMMAGYTRSLDQTGKVSDQPEANQYAVLIQGIEAMVSEFDAASQAQSEDDEGGNWGYTRDGRRFLSARG